MPTAPWDRHDYFPLCLTSLNPKCNTGSQPSLRNPLFYPHQVHYEFGNMVGSLIWWWNTYEKLLEAKQVWLVGKAQDLFTWGLRGPIHRLLREEAKCLGLLPHMHRAGARGVIPFHWTISDGGFLQEGAGCQTQWRTGFSPLLLDVICCFLSQLRHVCQLPAWLVRVW